MHNKDSKYFIYAGHQQFGPISFVSLIDEIQNENIGRDAFVWREGLQEWTPTHEIEEIHPYAGFLVQTTRTENFYSWRETLKPELDGLNFVEPKEEKKDASPPNEVASPEPVSARSIIDPSFKSHTPRMTLLAVLVCCLFVGVVSSIYLFYGTDTDPFWASLETTPEEIKVLRGVLQQPSSARLQFAAVPFKGDVLAPALFLVSNRKGPERIRIYLEGIRDSLVGALSASMVYETEMRSGRAETPPLRQITGQFLPKGRYWIRVSCLSCQGESAREVVLAKPLLIGSGASYEQELSSYHVLLREQAASELMELNEMISVFEDQRPGRSRRTDTDMMLQIGRILNGVNAEEAAKQYLYYPQYLHLKKAMVHFRRNQWVEMREAVAQVKASVYRLQKMLSIGRGYPQTGQEGYVP